MSGIKSEYESLKEKRLHEQTDIIDRIDNILDRESFFVNTVGDDIYRFFIPENLKDDRSKFISLLLERKTENINSETEKQVLNLLSKVIRKKLTVSDTAQKLAISGIELLLLASYVSKNEQQKSLYLHKAKSVIGIASGQTIQEREEMKNTERVYFRLDERMTLTIPKEFQENQSTRELASIFVERINNIYSSSNNESVIRKNLEKLYNKITDSMDSHDEEFTEDEFTVLHYYMNDILRRIDDMEG